MQNQLNIWNMTDKEEPDCLESVELTVEDNTYGDNEESMYLTGQTKLGRFVEVVVTVPERGDAVRLGTKLHQIIERVMRRKQDGEAKASEGS